MKSQVIALAYGIFCHAFFVLAVVLMGADLFSGLRWGAGELHGLAGFISNFLLLLQFPVLHSFLLSKPGTRLLKKLAPLHFNSSITTTLYVQISSLQLLLSFVFWSPSSIELFKLPDALYYFSCLLFACSWILLAVAMWEAGSGVQFGWLGWWSNFTGVPAKFPSFARNGLHSLVRHPIYLSFFLILLTAPIWTLDHLIIFIFWGSYCLIGPILKEKRFAKRYGQSFEQYKHSVPYFIPNGIIKK